MEEKRLSINFAERTYSSTLNLEDEDTPLCHAYLILVEETHSGSTIVQELHFNNYQNEIVYPNVRNINKALHEEDGLALTPYIVGQEKAILSMWNHGLKHAADIKNMNLKFGEDYRILPYASNCRTGVKVVLETIGMTFCPEFAKSMAGTKSEGMPIGEKFSFSHVHDGLELSELRAKNAELAALLPDINHIF